MKKSLSKIQFLIISVIIFVVTTFLFGIIVGGTKFLPAYLGLAFVISCLIYWKYVIRNNVTNKLKKTFDYIEMIVFSFVIIGILILFYFSVNKVKSHSIKEYDTVITDVHYKFTGTAWFTDPDDEEQSADLNDWRIIYDENTIQVGDEVHIIEKKGFFDISYFIISDKEK